MPFSGSPDTGIVGEKGSSLLSPASYDDDAASLHSRSEQDTDSEDDELMLAARNSRELRARDRLVLMEEEEMDRLVEESRSKNNDRIRRGSNLSIPNPIGLFRRGRSESGTRNASNNNTYSRNSDPSSSVEDFGDEKRRAARRARRQQKRDKLLQEAQDGEDRQLMYEMESGGMKDGSSTGESSDRDDSDELDRMRLVEIADAKTAKNKRWRIWAIIYTTIAVGFVLLVLLAWRFSLDKKRGASAELVSNGTALFGPTTIIISLDGFRADFLTRGLTPRLNAFIKEGVSPLYMNPSFPSVTFPNHYTLATGLYPEAHGVVGNTFWDPELAADFYYTDPDKSMDPKWWNGEPFWATAELQGLRTAIHMWPGSEAHILGVEPSFLDKYNGKESLSSKVSRILEFLDKPGMEDSEAKLEDMRPQLIAAYVPNVDGDGHRYGPNSTEIRATISAVDTMLDQIFTGLEERNLTDIVNVIIVSDHGMATTDVSRMMQIDDLIDLDKVHRIDGWPLSGIRPKNPDDLQSLYDEVMEKTRNNPNVEVYLRDKDMPERYHFSNNDRIAPLWIIPKTGWAIVERTEFDIAAAKEKDIVYHPRGLHGYDHEHPLMRAIFVARGPAFPHQPHSKVEPFQNINVYNILCDSIGLEPRPNNGTLRLPLKTIGVHDSDPETALQEVPDPAPEDAADGAIMSILPVPSAPSADGQGVEQPGAPVGVSPPGSEVVNNNGGDSDRPEVASSAAGQPTPTAPSSAVGENENDQNQGNDNDNDGDDDDEEDGSGSSGSSSSFWDSISGTWNWVTNKFDELIDKISSSGRG
ncbi:alkaline-phosphatase-like protein [Microdochium trichocladiopsis]|uniref:Alkaline-phosphatase-like protein n=1 Tax=Microdochium trichocladiopsis TaxID=1682393 RepID=A0A9P8YGH0_9PEZI|nr:alkaline-phosphatase-like protein [Microdochium trichocladiopsis]KAH7037508.1 alkaline-phosphatase-like protein [Microdochium trichocladiopsis]